MKLDAMVNGELFTPPGELAGDFGAPRTVIRGYL